LGPALRRNSSFCPFIRGNEQMKSKADTSGSQSKSQLLHGRPPFAGSQETKILELLRRAGSRGVCKKVLVFELHFTQASSRVHSLEQRGFKIRHEMRAGDDYVTFVLESSPPETEARTSNSTSPRVARNDWYERETGKARPSGRGTTKPDLPLFGDAAVQP
jgi:helix-turn-helix protein